MPRSIAEVNAIRRSNRNPAETSGPGQPSGGAHGRHGFDPNQPRAPAGHHDGGQWTDSVGTAGPAAPNREVVLDDSGEEAWESVTSTYRPDGTLAEQEVLNRDGSRIHSQFSRDPRIAGWDERHTVVAADGTTLTFETSGDAQTIYDAAGRPISAAVWTEDGAEPLPLVQPAFLPAIPPAIATFELALVLLAWLSTRNGRNSTAVFSSRLRQYEPDSNKELKATWVGSLTDSELKKVCDKFDNVQDNTNEAADATDRAMYETAAAYGTEVHAKLEQKIKVQKNPNFRAEVSLLKTLAETGEAPELEISRGRKGSVRVDVLENTKNGTVCVYDIKTGKSGLYPGRSAEIARTVRLRYPNAQRILMIEVRPRQK